MVLGYEMGDGTKAYILIFVEMSGFEGDISSDRSPAAHQLTSEGEAMLGYYACSILSDRPFSIIFMLSQV